MRFELVSIQKGCFLFSKIYVLIVVISAMRISVLLFFFYFLFYNIFNDLFNCLLIYYQHFSFDLTISFELGGCL